MTTIRPTLLLAAGAPRSSKPAGVDMSVVDSPEKAILLPALGASSNSILTEAMAMMSNGGPDEVASLQMVNDTTTFSLNYKSDAASNSLIGQGHIGGVDFQETWTSKDDNNATIVVTGKIGKSDENLEITEDVDGTHIDGTIGSVAVHEVISDSAGSDPNSVIGYTWDGTVGGKAYKQQYNLGELNGSSRPVSIQGSLGNAPVTMTGQEYPMSNGYAVAAQGNLAGTPVTAQQDIKSV